MDFIRSMVARDLAAGKYDGRVVTRFPPEPNGFLHIGHAKAITLNFGVASEHPNGRCHLRLDDTNPGTEKAEYVEAMKRDIRWLGFDWGDHLYHASDYFPELYDFAMVLVDKGLAYVDSSSEDEIRERRGSLTTPGVNSPYRNRAPQENRSLFRRMRAGEFPDGSHVLRAKIDMAHPNMVMRDPILYRIRHAHHYRQGSAWPIYPLYDFAHCLSDSLERITHSLCTLEFDNNREIYDWLLEHVDAPAPRPEQTEFAALVLDYVITSKRKLRRLVEEGHVRGWDDPRMPTLAGLRRRGVTPRAIRSLCEMVGVAKANSRIDPGKLDYAVRNDLNRKAPRAFCVLEPLTVTLLNWPEDREEWLEAPCFPKDVGKSGTRRLPFGRTLCIDREDFRDEPPSGFRRLSPGRVVRLKYAGLIRCESVVRNPETGRPEELRCTFSPEAPGSSSSGEGPRVAGTIHWLSVPRAVAAEARIYDRLFSAADPLGTENYLDALNPESERIIKGALVEPGIADTRPGAHYQFERHGYFFSDPEDSRSGRLVFNRTVPLRDGWKTARASPPRQAKPTKPAAPVRPPTDETPRVRNQARFDLYRAAGVAPPVAASLSGSPALGSLWQRARDCYAEGAASLASWLANEVAGLSGTGAREAVGADRLEPKALADLVRAVDDGSLSRRQGRAVLAALLEEGGSFERARASLDLTEISDRAVLAPLLDAVIAEYPDKAAACRNGRRGLVGFFVGEVMKRTDGKADPRAVSRLAATLLSPRED